MEALWLLGLYYLQAVSRKTEIFWKHNKHEKPYYTFPHGGGRKIPGCPVFHPAQKGRSELQTMLHLLLPWICIHTQLLRTRAFALCCTLWSRDTAARQRQPFFFLTPRSPTLQHMPQRPVLIDCLVLFLTSSHP